MRAPAWYGMYLTTVPPAAAIGHILAHNLTGADGRKALSKGRRLAEADVERLQALGVDTVRVAVLEADDVHEDEAAHRLAAVVRGPGLNARAPAAGRVNLLAAAHGVVRVDAQALLQINSIEGLTVATLPCHALARERKRVATIKVIPFAVHAAALEQAEAIGREHGPILSLAPLRALDVGVVLIGSITAHKRIQRGVYPAIEARVLELGSRLLDTRYVEPDPALVAAAIDALHRAGAGLLIVAGETSIVDRDDVAPQAIQIAGGRIEHYGAPVEPGNLLLLAYIERGPVPVPVIGAPGCIRSRDTNIVDLVLPRLLAGEQVRQRDIIALGHGGLLA